MLKVLQARVKELEEELLAKEKQISTLIEQLKQKESELEKLRQKSKFVQQFYLSDSYDLQSIFF